MMFGTQTLQVALVISATLAQRHDVIPLIDHARDADACALDAQRIVLQQATIACLQRAATQTRVTS